MTRFAKIYEAHKKKKLKKIEIREQLSVEGYGYIKRRVGLLSSELNGPTYSKFK